MQLEDYFDFADYAEHGEIRLQGNRVWMHDILREHLDNGLDARQLLERYPTLSLEKVYASLLYFESHRDEMLAMLGGYKQYCKRSFEKAKAEGRVVNLAKLRERVQEPAIS